MPSLHRPVHFTHSAPFDISSGLLVFYDVVEPSVMSRSSVLSCIAEAGGEAMLPDAITVSDFRKWLVAVADSQSEFQSRSFSSMCTALKVADAVDDTHIDDWIQVAGKHLIRNALPSSSMNIKQDIFQGLSLLTDHVQHRVFAAAAFDPQTLHKLLEFFPTRLHASVLSAIITPERLLRMLVSDASLPALKALACLPASPPSVLSFQFDDTETFFFRAKEEYICECLAEALHHHAGLTSLLLPHRWSSAAAHELLFPAIATLTSLQSLHLTYACTFPEGEPTLRHTLQALPHLHTLKLRLDEAFVASPKRKRDAGAPASPNCCLVDMLSPATALTSLCLRASGGPSSRGRLTAAKSLPLPQLVQLSANFGTTVSLAASFFTHLSAPLTSLHFGEEMQDPERIPAAAAPAVRQLLHSLAAFTQLRCFNATLPTDKGGQSRILNTLTSALIPPLTAFRQLQSFTLAAEPAVVHRSITLLAPVASALTQLRLGFYQPDDHPFPVQNHSFTASWPDFFAAMRQMKLQHLDMDWKAHRPIRHGLSSLRPLTQLTFLRLKGWSCLDFPADGQALARMTLLQHLCFDHPCRDHPGDDFSFSIDCAAALRGLSALTCLTLKTSEEDSELVSALEDEVPPLEYLPALQQLAVSIFDPFLSGAQLVNYASGLPALKLLTVHLFPSANSDDDQSDSGESEEDAHYYHEMQHPPSVRLSEAEDELKTAAAFAGVELVVNTRAYDVL